MAITNEEKLKKLLSLMDEDGLTKEEFVKQFKGVVTFVKKIQDKNNKTIEEMGALHTKLQGKRTTDNDTNLANINANFSGEVDKIQNIVDNVVKRLELKMAEIKDGEDGLNADPNEVIKAVLQQIKIPDIKELGQDLPQMGEGVRDALELLQGKERLEMSAINGLEDLLKKLDEKKLGGGGGFSYAAMKRHFVEEEEPSGTVNGTNKDFTIAKAPNPINSLKVYVNGQRMTTTEDYTFAGITISFVTAPPTTSIVRVDYRF